MAQIKKLLTTCIINLQKWRNSGGNHAHFVKGEVLELEAATLLKQDLDDLQKPWPKKFDKKSKVIICNLCGATFLDIPSQLTHEKQHAKKKVNYSTVKCAKKLPTLKHSGHPCYITF